eukprot:scaffold20526_cov18-Tisochrysis_lutea.AAC.2
MWLGSERPLFKVTHGSDRRHLICTLPPSDLPPPHPPQTHTKFLQAKKEASMLLVGPGHALQPCVGGHVGIISVGCSEWTSKHRMLLSPTRLQHHPCYCMMFVQQQKRPVKDNSGHAAMTSFTISLRDACYATRHSFALHTHNTLTNLAQGPRPRSYSRSFSVSFPCRHLV